MYKKLDEFGLNHDEKFLKRVVDENKILTQGKKEKATLPSNNDNVANDDVNREYCVDHQKMQTIARSTLCDKVGEDAGYDKFVEGINKIVRKRTDAKERSENMQEDKPDHKDWDK